MGENNKYYFALTSGDVSSVYTNKKTVSVNIMFGDEDTLSDISYIPDTGSMIIVYSNFSLDDNSYSINICFNNQQVRDENVFKFNGALFMGYNILYYDSDFFINLSQKMSSVIPITYENLVYLRDNGELVPGNKYRITDYVTTTSATDTISNQKQFDIIVTAVSNDTLNEDALVMHHEGDEYFESSNLSEWRIKYSLSNDTSRFRWANSEGTGVIYYMKDEFCNEAPYDFKNIMFNVVDSDITYHLYTFNISTGQGQEPLDWSMTYTCNHNIIDECFENGTYVRRLNNVIFQSNNSMSLCEFNTIGQNSYDIKFNVKNLSSTYEASFIRNKIGKKCHNISFGYNTCEGNVIGDNSFEISFGNEVSENVIGNCCSNITFSDIISNDVIGYGTINITLGSRSSSNVIGNNCYNITIKGNGRYNNIGDLSKYITMGDNSSYNTFGSNCRDIKAGQFFKLNTFGNGCSYIVFSKTQVDPKNAETDSNLRDYCQNNTFANESSNICIYNDSTTSPENRINNLNVVFPRKSTETDIVLPIEIETLNLNINYELFVRRSTKGALTIFNLADLVIE